MELIVLGSGTAAPSLKRSNAAYLVREGKHRLLLDSGAGTIGQLLKIRLNLLDIENIFYTHFHNDHIDELPAIIWANAYGSKREKSLNLYGPKGFGEYIKILMKDILQIKPKELPYGLNVHEFKRNSEIDVAGFHVSTAKVAHTYNSIAYKIRHKGKSIVYCGDSSFDRGIPHFALDCDLLILECSLPDELAAKNHLTPSSAGKIAMKSNAGKLLLTHFYPEVEEVNIKKYVKRQYYGKVLLAKDFMRVRV